MKHYIDIERLREANEEIAGGALKYSNAGGFEEGDLISVQEKVDGANSSIAWEDGQIKCYSHKNELSPLNTLRGFYEFARSLDPAPFEKNPDFVFFGEWLVKHTVVYNSEAYGRWYLFSIWDKKSEQWLCPSVVRAFGKEYGFDMPNELYFGQFKSWSHVKGFLNSPALGASQEGVVITNESKMNNPISREPFMLKIVNESFKEKQKSNHVSKVLDPQKIEAKDRAYEAMKEVVTEARVRKELNKMVDEGILPAEITPKEMGIVAKNLPRRIFEDCLKEEKETVFAAGEYAGKACSSISMDLAKKILM